MFGQGYIPATLSYSMPNSSLTPYTPGCNDRAYTNTNGNYQATYTTVGYTDHIPLPGGSNIRCLTCTNNNTMCYATYNPPDHGGYGYETPPKFHFRTQPVEMMPAQATTETCVDPNNLTTQLATILRESS
jgi:hypothetical protein